MARKWYQPPKIVVASVVGAMVIDPIVHGVRDDPLWLYLMVWAVMFLGTWAVYEFLKWIVTGDNFW